MGIREELARIVWENANPGLSADEWFYSTSTYRTVDAILARFAVVELPEGAEDEDGQTYFDDGGDIRVDHTGQHGPEIWGSGHEVSPDVLRRRAAEFLAAARDAEVQS
ncbi:hypothetical protein ICV35_24920 [Rhodococcus ruber]|uniref:hypothetical protein n=1 Tax=Rhodococcus ruber TaxID=1830 RepID=UPI00177CCE8B|nr:hypothetical protein [Rhodococcus ruber]MBD8056893.1 hypothetical protein [Rhodococcus ruber]